MNIRIISKLHLVKQQMLEAYHMVKQFGEARESHLGEADKPLGVGGGIKASLTFFVVSRANGQAEKR